jgi:RNA polymerase sigma-70 factor (ECF subfamily)
MINQAESHVKLTEVSLDEVSLDVELMRSCQAGDEEAFAKLVHRHATRAYGLAYRMLGNAHDAEDVVQEVFIKIWRKPCLWDEGRQCRFSTWLHRVVVHKCLDYRRKRKDAEDIDAMELPAPGREFGHDVDQAQRLRRVHQAIQNLPQRQRAAIVLCYQEGYSQKEATAILGVSIKALESLLSRAKTALKAMAELSRNELL